MKNDIDFYKIEKNVEHLDNINKTLNIENMTEEEELIRLYTEHEEGS